ncbi:hypothetical protein SAMN05443247_07003 [Bradyrhizobium erythrophlei]|jgi:hypothetical protein|nr:hypothetical protein SAMN05443247_07003 [Bradyrhizobium erythrophlei]
MSGIGGDAGEDIREPRLRIDADISTGGQWTLSAEYVETESGRRSDRPKLAAALSHAKAIGAKLVW